MCFWEESYKKMQKIYILKFMKSGSMPLTHSPFIVTGFKINYVIVNIHKLLCFPSIFQVLMHLQREL